jgi:hypothetical protein
MADENNTPTENTAPQNAQQALDDLTVLSDVGNQDMGAARLNTPRPADVSEGALGGLANIHQGSSSGPVVQDGFNVQGGPVGTDEIGIDADDIVPVADAGPSAGAAQDEDAIGQEGDTAPKLDGKGDLSDGNKVFGDPLPSDVAPPAPAVFEREETEPQDDTDDSNQVAEARVPEEPLLVPEAPEEYEHIDLPPVFGGIRIDPNPYDEDPTLVPTPMPVSWKEDQVLRFGVDATDPDGGAVTISFVQPTFGTVTVNDDGTYSYTPNRDYYGADQFTVIVTDDEGNQVTQVIQLDIANVDDATVVSGPVSLGSMAEDSGSITFTAEQLLANATDIDNALHVANVTVDGGTVVDNGDGTYTFTPDKDFSGSISVSYDVVTDTGVVTPAGASLEVEGVADGATLSVTVSPTHAAGPGGVEGVGGSATVTVPADLLYKTVTETYTTTETVLEPYTEIETRTETYTVLEPREETYTETETRTET